MKKSFKRTLAKGLSVVMAFSMLAVAPADDADAAKAKKPKMAKKSYSVTVGKKVTVKISSKKKVKKTTWSLSKKDKKKISLSKKKAKSVVVKGKKAKTTATLKAKVKVGKKSYKLSVKVKVKAKKVTPKVTAKPTEKVTAKATTKPTKVPTPTALVLKDKDEKSYVIDESKTLNIPVTSLNETAMSCDDKFDTEENDKLIDYAHVGAEFTKNGASFTTGYEYTDGMSFYLDPITSENDLEDVTGTEGVRRGIVKLPKEGKGKEVDIADYDVIRIAVKTEKELNVRVWNKTNYDKIISGENGWIGDTAAIYNGWDSTGRGDYTKKEPVKEGSSSTANVYYKDKAQTIPAEDGYIVLPVKEVVKAAKQSSFVALGVCGQFKGQDITIKSIELMKVKDSKSATAPNSVSVKAADNKTKIVNGSELTFTAEVLDKNEQVMDKEAVVWSVDGDAAIIKETENGATLTADATKTGEVTVVAASKTDANVKAEYKVTVCDPKTTLSLGFTNKYTTYTLEEAKAGIALTAEGLNGAGNKAENQPEKIEVKLEKEVDGFAYAEDKLTATKAGEVTLVATSNDLPDAKVTIKVVEGMRVALTAATYKEESLSELSEDNTGNVFKFGYNMQGIDNSMFVTNDDGSVQLTTANWATGMAVKAKLPEGMTLANVKGIYFNYASDNVSGGDGRECIVDVESDPSKVTFNKELNKEVALYKTADIGNKAYAETGVNVEATWKWADVKGDVDLTVTEPIFRIGVNSAGNTIFKLSNVIVLTGEADPAVKFVADTAEVVVKDTCELTASVLTMPKTDSVKDITFASSDEEVATVKAGTYAEGSNKVTVTGVKAGKATITATMTTTAGKTATATATVTVKDPSVKIAEVTKPIILQNTEKDAEGTSPFITADAAMEVKASVTASKDAKIIYKWEITDATPCATLTNETTDTVKVTATKVGDINLKVTATVDGKDFTDTVVVKAQIDKLVALNASEQVGEMNPTATVWENSKSFGTGGSPMYNTKITVGSILTVKYKYYDAFQNEITGEKAKDLYQLKIYEGYVQLGSEAANLDGSGTYTYTYSVEKDNLSKLEFQNKVDNTGVSYIVMSYEIVAPLDAND